MYVAETVLVIDSFIQVKWIFVVVYIIYPLFLVFKGPICLVGYYTFQDLNEFKEDKWLAIQGANTYGNDKVTLDERVEWARGFANTADAIACDPFRNTEWMKADDPWQFLAWCFEWAEYCAKGSLNSYLPVNMDASNNGLQILSMLMRDEYGCLSHQCTTY